MRSTGLRTSNSLYGDIGYRKFVIESPAKAGCANSTAADTPTAERIATFLVSPPIDPTLPRHLITIAAAWGAAHPPFA